MDDYQKWSTHSKKRNRKNGSLVPKKPEEFNADDFKMMEKNKRPKSSCILALVLMSALAFLSANQPKKFGMPSK